MLNSVTLMAVSAVVAAVAAWPTHAALITAMDQSAQMPSRLSLIAGPTMLAALPDLEPHVAPHLEPNEPAGGANPRPAADALHAASGGNVMVAVSLITDQTLPIGAAALGGIAPAHAAAVSPIPDAPALWLLGAALFGLVTVARRRPAALTAPLAAASMAPAPVPAAAPDPALDRRPAFARADAVAARAPTTRTGLPQVQANAAPPSPAMAVLPACPALAATALPS